MTVELVVPRVGESITEVQIVDWLKREGESVDKDGNVAVIESDKATVELPSPVRGILTRVLKAKGEMAKVGEVIGYVEEGVEPDAPASKAAPLVTPETATAPRVMPAARRALAEKGLASTEVKPTGPGGRILKEDVYRAATEAAAPTASTAQTLSPERREEIVPMSMLRRRVAERLVEAQRNAALLTTFNEVDMGAVMELRRKHQEAFQKKFQFKLGFMSFFVKAVVEALGTLPQLNAEVRGQNIVYRRYIDLGVAIGGGKGLVVPVLRNAERMGFAQIELAIADFAKRAQANALALEELQGGTFTISNGGVYGSLLSTPIVNPPQSGVLGMHAIQDRPMARDGQVVIRPMMYVALTYDHRIVDGREAVGFLKRIKETVEDPARLLLEV